MSISLGKNFLNIIKKHLNNQKGYNIIFYALFVFPILSFLLAITFDVASIYTKRRGIQHILDEATLQGVKVFPYKDQAKVATIDYLNKHGVDSNYYTVNVNDTGIEVKYHRDHAMVFSNVFNYISQKNNKLNIPAIYYPVSAYSFASPSVSDYLLLLDRNSYNAPRDVNNLWGSEGQWPAAIYFNQNEEEFGNPRYYTQQCFNEVFLPLKNLLLETYYFLGSVRLNSIGIATYPGGNYSRDFETLKDIAKANFDNKEAKFFSYTDDDGFSSTSCYNASIIGNEIDKYSIPKNLNNYDIHDISSDVISDDLYSSIKTSVWSIPVHVNNADFLNVFDYSMKTLMAAQNRKDRFSDTTSLRKNLIIFTSNLYDKEGDLQAEVNKFESIAKNVNLNINVIFVLLKNTHSTKKDIFHNNLNTSHIKILVISKESEEELKDYLFRLLWLNKKEGSIWR